MTANYDKAGLFLMISGVLHLPMFLVTGFAGAGALMLVTGLLWVFLGHTLRTKQPRWLAWLCYFLMLFGVLASLVIIGSGTLPFAWGLLIFLADLMAAFFLFKVLWADKTLT